MTLLQVAGSVAVAFLIAVSPAAAQTGSDRIGELVTNGQKVTIVDDEGRELSGRVQGLSTTGLKVVTKQGPFDLPFDRIVKIDRPHDGLGNGALMGMGATVGLTVLSLATVDHSCPAGSNPRCSRTPAWVWMWAVGSSAAFGAGIGVAIDAMIHEDRAIYRRGTGPKMALVPTVGRGIRGAAVSVSW